VLAAGAVGLRLGRERRPRWWRALRTSALEARAGLLGHAPAVVLLSVVALAGHVGLFLVAASAAGVAAPLTQLVPLAVVALLAMSIPVNVGGWGPREAATAAAFAAAGLGAQAGVTVSVVYGLLALVAAAPGAVSLVARAMPSGNDRVRAGFRAGSRRAPRPAPGDGPRNVG
uniref:lysylphosphatidylglycerol synthase domain-containing protein n=1 Tax=Nocardiopsis salina TaxID=245836 RepID=UPI00187324DE